MSGASRFVAILSLTISFAAFVASLLALLSGQSTGFFPEGQLLTLNISRIGQTPVFGSASNTNCKRDLFSSIGNDINCATGTVQSGINSVVGNVAGDIASALHLPDFFDVHVRNFCTGDFEPSNYVEQGITNPQKNITFCSPVALSFSFDPTATIQNALPSGVSLADIQWPSSITTATTAIKLASHIVVFAYIIGIGAAGFVTLMSILGIFTSGSFLSFMTLVISGVGFFALAVTSIASTVLIIKATNAINDDGAAIGVAAEKGIVYLGLTIGSAAGMLVVMLVALMQRCTGRRSSKYYD